MVVKMDAFPQPRGVALQLQFKPARPVHRHGHGRPNLDQRLCSQPHDNAWRQQRRPAFTAPGQARQHPRGLPCTGSSQPAPHDGPCTLNRVPSTTGRPARHRPARSPTQASQPRAARAAAGRTCVLQLQAKRAAAGASPLLAHADEKPDSTPLLRPKPTARPVAAPSSAPFNRPDSTHGSIDLTARPVAATRPD